jgi:NADPH:quinone reductase-like Zn-dependent oxidoreductase
MLNKVALAQGGAGIDAIRVVEQPVPDPGPGEALVRLTAATLNYRDLLFISGRLASMTKTPHYVPLSCATGEVVSVGSGVEGLKAGDRVNPTFHQGQARDQPMPLMLGGNADGVARQWAVFPAGYLCRVPDELGDLEAATLACAGLTAWSALFDKRPLQPGETVLLQGTGGVSLAALQWAKAAGATVVITSSSDAKLNRAKALGADYGVNYRDSADWAGAARRALGGEGVDIVVDVAGASQLQASASLLNEGGLIAAIGMLDGDFSWNAKVDKPLAAISVGSPEQHGTMLAFAARHHIRPVVDMVYDLERIGDAMHRLESGRFFGKIGIGLQ